MAPAAATCPRSGGGAGLKEIAATRRLEQSPEVVFAFLADLRNHWRLSRRFAELEALEGDLQGGRVRIVGPLGLSRTTRTRVVEAVPPRRVAGRADVGRRTVGSVRWTIDPDGGGSTVTLAATVDEASPLDRAILALGGRRHLARTFEEALAALAEAA